MDVIMDPAMSQLVLYEGCAPQLRQDAGPQLRPKRPRLFLAQSSKVTVQVEVYRSNLCRWDQVLSLEFLLSTSLKEVARVVSEILAWNPARCLIVGGPHDSVLTGSMTVRELTTGGRSYWCRVFHVR